MKEKIFDKIGLAVPKILMPKKNINMTKWSVVACDQYTSQPDYWHSVEEFVGEEPSTLKIIFPEVYLENNDKNERIKKINETMKKYLKEGLFEEINGFILIDRSTSKVPSRKGLVVALDLEKYDYNKGSETLIRATEETIIERLPPRIAIRKDAELELPHIMVLIDDPEKKVIEPLFENNHELIYDFDLMMNSGHIKGWKITAEEEIKNIANKLSLLANKDYFEKKYSVKNRGVLLFAMGDGNHSLATAKAVWEEKKKKGAGMDDPARFALVEVVNVHDEGLIFEPIHRVMFNVNTNKFFEEINESYKDFERIVFKDYNNMKEALKKNDKEHRIMYVTKEEKGLIIIKNPDMNLEVGTLQKLIDEYLKKHEESKVDYIHGEEVVYELGSKENNIGFFLPAMNKRELFRTIILEGSLPRKTFSMGEADEKRFYLEARRIK